MNNFFPLLYRGDFFIWHYYDESCFSPWSIRHEIRLAKSHRKSTALSLSLSRFTVHGENKAVAVEDFEQTAQCLEEQIQHLIKNEPYILIGYSLGGRIAQYYALQAKVKIGHLKAVILEGRI